MRLELTCVGLSVWFANHYTTRGARPGMKVSIRFFSMCQIDHLLDLLLVVI